MRRQSFAGLVTVFSFLLCLSGSYSGAADTASASLSEEIDASNIDIKAVYKIADENSFTGDISYSPDGRFLLYSRKSQKSSNKQIVIVNVATRKKEKVLDLRLNEHFEAWAPDGTRIVTQLTNKGLSIRHIESGKIIDIDLHITSSYGSALTTWFEDDKIFLKDRVLDLNSLSFREPSKEEFQILKNIWDPCSGEICFAGGNILTPRTSYSNREYFYIKDYVKELVKSTYSSSIPSVVVFNKDGSFTKVLVELSYKFVTFELSPKKDSFAFPKDGLYLAYLGSNFKTEKGYSVEDFRLSLSDDLKSAYNSFISDNILIVGEVYSPRINPLTGKVIGPGTEYKGSVRITGIENDKFTVVQKMFERVPFKPGEDVVSNLVAISGEVGYQNFTEFNVWRTIQSISEKEIKGLKEEQQKQKEAALVAAKDLLEKGEKAFNAGDSQGAIDIFSKVIDLDINYADAYYARGFAYAAKGHLDTALVDLNKAIELDKNQAKYYYMRGWVYSDDGKKQYDKGIEDFDKAISLDPGKTKIYIKRARSYLAKGDQLKGGWEAPRYYRQAVEDLSKAIDLAPDNADAYGLRGIVYSRSGNLEKAVEDLKKAASLGDNVALDNLKKIQQMDRR